MTTSNDTMTQSSGSQGSGSAGLGIFRDASESSTTSTPPVRQSQQTQQRLPDTTQQTPGGQPPQAQPAQTAPQASQVGQQPPLTAESIAQAIRMSQQQPAQQPEYTAEQFKRDFGVVEVDKPLMDAMFGMDAQPEQVEAMNQLVKQIVGMSLKMADYRTQQALKQGLEPLSKKLTPLEQKYQEYQNSQFTQQFFSKYNHLKNFNPIVKTVVSQLQSSGQKFKTAEQAMQAIASQTEMLLRQAGVAINPQQAQQPGVQQHRPQGPARVSTGGGVGTTPSASSTRNESRGLSVFR